MDVREHGKLPTVGLARFELTLDQWIVSLGPTRNRLTSSNIWPLLKSFESKGSRYHNEVISSTGRDLSNWESFGYYTGWRLHCDRSQKARLDKLLEDALSRTEIPEIRKKQFSKTRAEWMSANTVNCQQSDRVARFEALNQWILSLS